MEPKTPSRADVGSRVLVPPASSLTSTSRLRLARPLQSRESRQNTLLRVVAINLGCRNTNPLEFELKGNGSETAGDAIAVLRRAKQALRSSEEGPKSMLAAELQLIGDILDEIYIEGNSDMHAHVQDLFCRKTWEAVLKFIQSDHPHLFNALNLLSLELNRPSVWDNSAACHRFNTTKDYLLGWKQWYCGLDRASPFWLQNAPRAAAARGIDVATAFAGLLVYDVMSLCVARSAVSSSGFADVIGAADAREVPFEELVRFAATAPASNRVKRGQVAEQFIEGTHIILAQEACDFTPDLKGGLAPFLGPFCANGGWSSVLLRRAAFKEATDITEEVGRRMEELAEHVVKEEPLQVAWRSAARSLGAASGQCHHQVGGFKVCVVSLHCSKQLQVADFLNSIRDVLVDYGADINIVGVNANCSSKDTAALQCRLVRDGFDIGCQPKQHQVTVAKRRTCFQTQLQKIGEMDISHKDYVVSWASKEVRRQETTYTPDLRTAYGVNHETKQCVTLPSTSWPFDHCGVATSFKPRYRWWEMLALSRRSVLSFALVLGMFAFLLLPLASSERENPYGQPGTWHREAFIGTRRVGICERLLPCAQGRMPNGSSCYTTTPRLGYLKAQDACQQANSELVSITSEAENQFVTSLCPEDEFCWIGLRTNHAGDHAWWASGEPVNYNNALETDASLFPFFPMSRAYDYQVVVLSNMPGEIGRCGLEFLGPLQRVPKFFYLLNLCAPGVAMGVSGLVLLLPRPTQALTTIYLTAAFSVNMLWFGGKMVDVCFTESIQAHRFAYTFHLFMDGGGHAIVSLMSFFIILKRMQVLYPCRALKVSFCALVAVTLSMMSYTNLFIDTTAGLNPSSPFVWVLCLQAGLLGAFNLTAAALISSDLRRTWVFLQREAVAGISKKGSSSLAKEVLAARLHFFTVLTALTSGATRCLFFLASWMAYTQPDITKYYWLGIGYTFSTVLDSITNDFCTHFLATVNMDGAVVRARGISAEVAERANLEVEQHRVAVQVLKAAPTSAEQLSQLALLEGRARNAPEEDRHDFLALQSVVWAETARIHQMMECVRLRAMTMPVRYQYIIEVPALEGEPRQHIPAQFAVNASADDARKYFEWLYAEAEGGREVLFQQVKQLLANFNSTPWPTDLGLVQEQFPWMISAKAFADVDTSYLSREAAVSPGDVLIHQPAKNIFHRVLSRDSGTLCFVLDEGSISSIRVHCSGMDSAQEVPREELRTCAGGGVFVPGPKKLKQRCLDKIAADYEGAVPWPAAASLTDLCRCQIVLDDPYAMAVLVEYIRSKMRVVRLKNRFSEDILESKSPEELQSIFLAPSDIFGEETRSRLSFFSTRIGDHRSATSYRDISINVEVMTPNGVPFICEIQVTLANLAILKHADQKLYTIRRMKSPTELQNSYVFASRAEEQKNTRDGEVDAGGG